MATPIGRLTRKIQCQLRLLVKTPPTSTLVIVKGLAHPDYLIEIAGIAVI